MRHTTKCNTRRLLERLITVGRTTKMAMNPEEFQERLDAISEKDGVQYGRAHMLFDSEEKYGQAASQYKGYLALSDAFKCLFLETVETLNTECRMKIADPFSEYYAMFLPRLSHSFKSLCASERIALRGYPLHAYTILRNTFDNVVLTSAAVQKITDFYCIEGVERGKDPDLASIKKIRKKAEFDARAKITGDQSGLSASTIAELAKWDDLFDYEVHGARLSLAGAIDWMEGKAPLPVLPSFDERQFSMFVNRYCEIGWMVHRLLPFAQQKKTPLPVAWQEKWKILDNSFEIMVFALTEQCGKQIGAAIVELVKAKFPFDEKTVFTL